MRKYNDLIRSLIDVKSNIMKIPKNMDLKNMDLKTQEGTKKFNEMLEATSQKLKTLTDTETNLSQELNLDKDSGLLDLINAEAAVKEMAERPDFNGDELLSLVRERDSQREKNGYVNYNKDPKEIQKEKNISKEKNESKKKRKKEKLDSRTRNSQKNKNEKKQKRKDKIKKNTEKRARKERAKDPRTNAQIEADTRLQEHDKRIEQEKKDAQKAKAKENSEKEAERRKNALEEKRKVIEEKKLQKEKEFYDNKWYNKDSFIDKYIKTVEQEKKDASRRIIGEKRENQKKVHAFEQIQKRFEEGNFEENGPFSKESVERFMNDPLNKLDYEEAKVRVNSQGHQMDDDNAIKNIQAQRDEIIHSRKVEEKEFIKDYVNSHIEVSEFEKNNPGFDKNTEGFKDYDSHRAFVNENEEKFNGINSDLKDELFKEANDKLELEKTNKIFEEKESALKSTLDGHKEELRNVNQDIKKMKKNKSEFSADDYESQMEELLKKKGDIKSNLKESKKEYMSRNDSRLYENEVNKLNKEAKIIDNMDTFKKAEASVKAGDMSQEVFDELKADLFGDGEVAMPKRTKAQIEEEIEKNMKLVKKFNGTVRDAEEDIVDVFKGKLKNANKFNMAFAGFSAISQYKTSRKEGRGVVSSVARAGIDFALSEALGGAAYLGLSIAKEVPGALVKGTELLHKEVRNMNTASRFSVFGQAQFQDTQQLATMRQSGMEMAKMANYRLEQTLMGNEAKYLHK